MSDAPDTAKPTGVCRDGLIRAFYLFRAAPLPERFRTEKVAEAEVLFWPLRSMVAAIIAITPLLIAFYSPRLDNFYAALLMSFLYWLILEKLSHMRRPAAFCRTCEKLAERPGSAVDLSDDDDDRRPVTVGAAARLVILYAAKVAALYIFCAKYLLTGTGQSSETAAAIRLFYLKYLRLSDSHFMLLLFLLTIPVLVEAGAVLLYCGDAPNQQHKSPLLLLPGLLAAGAAGALLAIMAGPNAIIMPTALVIIMVFYWKKQADHHLGGLNAATIDAYRETAELAVVAGLVLIA